MEAEGEAIVIKSGNKVKLNYELTVNGDVIDSTTDQEPFQYIHGKNQIIPALEKQLESLNAGDRREIILGPDDAYGALDPQAYIEIEKSELPQTDLKIGTRLGMISPEGQTVPATVVEIRLETVILNLNHPLAGKELHFVVQILSIS